jgi:hypothetical protein
MTSFCFFFESPKALAFLLNVLKAEKKLKANPDMSNRKSYVYPCVSSISLLVKML